MNSAGDPELASVQSNDLIHPQSFNCGATLGSQANDLGSIFTPKIIPIFFPRQPFSFQNSLTAVVSTIGLGYVFGLHLIA
ncbi:MAG: hypothetical protein J2P52_13140 [Blastocatellia bacterium]|nr:hypothetical protein [Blastocatellia bacterium]